MNMEITEKSKLVAQLVKLLVPEEQSNMAQEETLSAVWQQLETMNRRLETIEKQFVVKPSQNAWLQLAPHPSQERFQIAEVNELLLPQTNERACRFEPDKPCDYCSMCSSRGF
jgi:hypothetical protein